MDLQHALSVDVEDWNSGVLEMWFGRKVPPERAVVENTHRMLALLQEAGATATWFFLGNVAVSHPDLVKRVISAGHVTGVHGFRHDPVWAQTPMEFRENLRKAKDAIEQAGGEAALGHRAATFSIGPNVPWAFEEIVAAGFLFDSSVFPFRGRRYGDPRAPVVPYRIATPGGPLFEVPLSVVVTPVINRRIPVCGGGYLRHFPYAVTRWSMKRLASEGRPANFFVHPYEFDSLYGSSEFRSPLGWNRRCRYEAWRWLQYRNRDQTEEKLRSLLAEFRFGSIEAVFDVARARLEGPEEGQSGG